jgi:hypothetical protein
MGSGGYALGVRAGGAQQRMTYSLHWPAGIAVFFNAPGSDKEGDSPQSAFLGRQYPEPRRPDVKRTLDQAHNLVTRRVEAWAPRVSGCNSVPGLARVWDGERRHVAGGMRQGGKGTQLAAASPLSGNRAVDLVRPSRTLNIRT